VPSLLVRRTVLASETLLVTAGLLAGAAVPAHAAGTVDATGSDGNHLTASPDSETILTVTGTGFQSIQAGFGGIYVMFGTVSGDTWQPSNGGTSGVDYRYVNDDPDDPAGFQQFIAFPGGSTEAEASGGTISAEGAWETTIEIPGAYVEVTDSSGTVSQLDCRVHQCGIITIGAHGVVNANNESFTPITFEATATETTEPTAEPSAAATPSGTGSFDAAPPGDATAEVSPLPFVGAAITALIAAALAAVLLVGKARRKRPTG